MTAIERAYAPLRHLSMDVALGSASTSLLMMESLARRVPLVHYGLLALAVWLIYAIDHTLDSYRLSGEFTAVNRHTFFRAHRAVIIPAIVIASGTLLAGLVRYRFPLWPNVLIVGLPTALYCIVDKWAKIHAPLLKSICIACGFTLGLSIFFVTEISFWKQAWPHAAAVFLLALHNVWIFQHQETDYDQKTLGERGSDHFMSRHSLLRKTPFVGVALISSCFVTPHTTAWMYILMATVLLLCDCFSRQLASHERYRLLGDGVFLLPLVMFRVSMIH